MTDGSTLPYAMDVAFNSVTPASSDLCKVGISVALKDAKLDEGAQTEVDVVVTNKTSAAVPTPIAIVGLPGDWKFGMNQLKELVKAQRIAAYEVRRAGSDFVLAGFSAEPAGGDSAEFDRGGSRRIHGAGEPGVFVLCG